MIKKYSGNPNIFGRNRETRAKLEYKTFTFLQNTEIPSPQPIFFDPKDSILALQPLSGKQILAHPANPLWAKQAPVVANWLAQIHKLSCPRELIAILPDATKQATWFLENETRPDYMRAYPDGEAIWNVIRQELGKITPTDSVLVHGDFWSGNILWEKGQLSGILDWENVAFGDPGFDVAYCRMEMIIDGLDEAAEIFLKEYEACIGKPIINLGLYELAVAVQPMWQHAPYLTTPPIQGRFRKFVRDAKQRLLASRNIS